MLMPPASSSTLMPLLSRFAVLVGEGEYGPALESVLACKAAIGAELGPAGAPLASLVERFEGMLEGVRDREERLTEIVERLDNSHTELRQLQNRLAEENACLKRQLRRRFSVAKVIGASPRMAKVLQLAQRVAETTVNVLITGETGTGKEMVAKVVHYSGRRRRGPFMAVNCTAVPDTLFESEFFGIEKGVATGVEKRKGLIEGADGGTLFLDEIGDMSEVSQSKILRVLEMAEVVPVGGRGPIPVDIRLVSATNRNLTKDLEDGRFRRDLYYRIKVVHLDLPPLRERRDDIPLLSESFLANFVRIMGRERMTFSREARDALLTYPWPGNIRELENEVERAVALSYSDEIQLEDLSREVRRCLVPAASCPDLAETADLGRLKRLEQGAIEACLAECGGNRTRAAKILGISRESLRRKLRSQFGGENPPENGAD
jgi:two-component system, NtrC family, response regulator HydG